MNNNDIAGLRNTLTSLSHKVANDLENHSHIFEHQHEEYALTNHTHSFGINDITNLQTELNNRSLTTHTHAISNITNLQKE